MPRRGRKQITDQRIFFATTTIRNWQKLFTSIEHLESLQNIIFKAVSKYKANLYGYVLMPDHFHILIYLEKGGPQLSQFIKDVKSISARFIFPGKSSIWMPRFDDIAIYTDKQFTTKLAYIHNNPVKANLVEKAEDYQFSSAKNWLLGIESEFICTDL